MTADHALGATKKGFPPPSSGIQRLLTASQRGLGAKVAGRIATPVAEPIPLAEPALLPAALVAQKGALDSVKVAFATGLYKTKAGVLGKRLFDEHGPALRAYLTVQLRSSHAASEALMALEDAVEHGSAEQFKKGPSQRAALFLAARNHIETERLLGDPIVAPMAAVPWEPTPPGKIEGWGRALDEMRFGLGEREHELLMLRHACGLEDGEVAYVVGAERGEVQRALEAAAGFAKLLLEDVFDEDQMPKLADVLADAFRVMPPTPEELAAAAKPAVVPLPEGTLIGNRYELAEKLGGGEFAYVYRARDVRVPGHTVALKLLHRVARTPAAREGAIRELSLIASAFHPSLVQFKDHGWYEDRLWFVMPFYQGRLLLDQVREAPLALDDGLAHFERLARGLAALHAAGIRHQDIKPENIFLVTMQNEVLPILLDLGVAAPSGEMALAGTPMYFPPEVAGRIFDEAHPVPLTAKADVFALALSLLHSIEEPDLSELEGVEVDAFLKKRAEHGPPGPRRPEHAFLTAQFERWLARDPAARPSAVELAEEIAAIRASRGGTVTRRTFALPAGLVSAATFAAVVGLLLLTALVTDTPARTIHVTAGAAPAAAAVAEPADESERARLLRQRLETEERRVLELEEELTNLRRRELGLAPRNAR